MDPYTCVCCGRPRSRRRGGFWSLQNYGGLSGLFCQPCYRLVKLDAWGRPKHPQSRKRILTQMRNRARTTVAV